MKRGGATSGWAGRQIKRPDVEDTERMGRLAGPMSRNGIHVLLHSSSRNSSAGRFPTVGRTNARKHARRRARAHARKRGHAPPQPALPFNRPTTLPRLSRPRRSGVPASFPLPRCRELPPPHPTPSPEWAAGRPVAAYRRLRACVPACLPACVPACLPACLPAFLWA